MATTLDQLIAEEDQPGHARCRRLKSRRKPRADRRPATAAPYTTLSFRDASSPLPMEYNPRKVFTQLFGEATRRRNGPRSPSRRTACST